MRQYLNQNDRREKQKSCIKPKTKKSKTRKKIKKKKPCYAFLAPKETV